MVTGKIHHFLENVEVSSNGDCFFAQCKGILIRESGKCLLVESEILIVESGILGLGSRKRAQGIRNPTESGIQNPSSTYKDCNPVAGIRNPRRGI